MINDIFEQTKKNIEVNNINSINDFQNHSNFIVSMSMNMKKNCISVSKFLHKNVYNHKSLLAKREFVEKIVFKIFQYYEKNSNKLPNDWNNTKNIPLERNICDYISGMTDRYASRLYQKIYE